MRNRRAKRWRLLFFALLTFGGTCYFMGAVAFSGVALAAPLGALLVQASHTIANLSAQAFESTPPVDTNSVDAAQSSGAGPLGFLSSGLLPNLGGAVMPDPKNGLWVYAASGDIWATDGSHDEQLTYLGDASEPAWLESSLLYIRRSRNSSDLWLENDDPTPQLLTSSSSPIIDQNHWVAQPASSVNGSEVYVLADRDKASTQPGDLAIWALDIASDVLQQVTYPPGYSGGDQDVAINPQDGGQLAFTRYAYDDNDDLTERVTLLDQGHRTAIPLTAADHEARQPAFAPDGVHLAFVQSDGPQDDLYVGSIDSSSDVPTLIDVQEVASGTIAQPAWSADSAHLAYLSLVDRQFDLLAVPVQWGDDGSPTFGSAKPLTHDQSLDADSRPLWLSPADASQLQSWAQAASASDGS